MAPLADPRAFLAQRGTTNGDSGGAEPWVDGSGVVGWRWWLYTFMARRQTPAAEDWGIPADRVGEVDEHNE